MTQRLDIFCTSIMLKKMKFYFIDYIKNGTERVNPARVLLKRIQEMCKKEN